MNVIRYSAHRADAATSGARNWWAGCGARLVASAVLLLGGTACEEPRGGGQDVSAQPGIFQGTSNGGALLDEDVACMRISMVLHEMDSQLNCRDVDIQACPDLIRPAGSAACTRFSEQSVQKCEGTIRSYSDCSQFESERCLLVSVLDEMTPGCVPPGPPGEPDGGLDGGSDAGDAGDAGDAAGPEAGLARDASPSEAGVDGSAIEAGSAVPADASTSSMNDAASADGG